MGCVEKKRVTDNGENIPETRQNLGTAFRIYLWDASAEAFDILKPEYVGHFANKGDQCSKQK